MYAANDASGLSQRRFQWMIANQELDFAPAGNIARSEPRWNGYTVIFDAFHFLQVVPLQHLVQPPSLFGREWTLLDPQEHVFKRYAFFIGQLPQFKEGHESRLITKTLHTN